MKINSVQRDIALKQGTSGFRSELSNYRGKKSADICDRGYSANYCGSFTGKSEAATSFLDRILKSKWFNALTPYTDLHNISASALAGLVMAGVMRPATIMSLPGKKDKEDKIYASGHAMASGIMGFLVSTAVTSPFDESIRKVFDEKKFGRGKFKEIDEKIAKLQAEEEANTITEVARKELKTLTHRRSALNTFVKNIPDWVIGVPRAMLTIALIPPILKYVFGLEKKKKSAPQQEQVAQAPKLDFIEKDVFKTVKGGAK